MALSYSKSMYMNAILLAAQYSGTLTNNSLNPIKQTHFCGTEPREDGQIHSIIKIWDKVLGRAELEKNA